MNVVAQVDAVAPLSLSCEGLCSWGKMMITAQKLIGYVTAEPFRPFRISMASGRRFHIRHPEMIAVSRSTARIFTSMSEDPEEAKEREHEVSLLLMDSVEPLRKSSRGRKR